MSYEPIITNNAQDKMKEWGIQKDELLYAFKSGNKEKGLVPNSITGIYRSTDGWETCAMYLKSEKGQWMIISCWKRRHYPKR